MIFTECLVYLATVQDPCSFFVMDHVHSYALQYQRYNDVGNTSPPCVITCPYSHQDWVATTPRKVGSGYPHRKYRWFVPLQVR